MSDLIVLFDGFHELSDRPYGGVADGGELELRYGDKTVSGGSLVPQQIHDIRGKINELSATMPRVER